MLKARAATVPRIRFETVTREAQDILPRMDVAVFVGFAAAGPLHVPVAVEDANQYTAIFGADLVLAWDPETGRPTSAHLGPSVYEFFANGGRRCWVIRVASSNATHNYLPLPGLLKCVRREDSGIVTTLEPAFARSRSEGSWSDHLQVRAVLRTRVLPVVAYDGIRSRLTVSTTTSLFAGTRPTSGSMVRLQFSRVDGSKSWLYARLVAAPAVFTITNDGTEPLGARQMVRLDFDLVKTSCGYGVPLFDYREERETMDKWALAKGEAGIEAYWREKNMVSIDGLPTGIGE